MLTAAGKRKRQVAINGTCSERRWNHTLNGRHCRRARQSLATSRSSLRGSPAAQAVSRIWSDLRLAHPRWVAQAIRQASLRSTPPPGRRLRVLHLVERGMQLPREHRNEMVVSCFHNIVQHKLMTQIVSNEVRSAVRRFCSTS